MLVLTRRVDEVLVIGEPPVARVRIVEISGDKVRLGVEAARSVRVDRAEVAERRAKRADGADGADGARSAHSAPLLDRPPRASRSAAILERADAAVRATTEGVCP